MSGIQTMHQLELSCPELFIVFTAAHDGLMADAFGRNVIAFLIRPLLEIHIKECIQKTARLSTEFASIKINQKTALPCRDILYLSSNQKYTCFYDLDENQHLSHLSLKHWCEELKPYGFIPISRSAAINLKYFRGIKKEKAEMTNGIQLEISRRFLPVLEKGRQAYMLHLANTYHGGTPPQASL